MTAFEAEADMPVCIANVRLRNSRVRPLNAPAAFIHPVSQLSPGHSGGILGQREI